MTRMTDIVNDLELAAKKLGMSIEEAVSILMGTHPTHVVVQAHKETAETEAKVAEGNAASVTPTSEPASTLTQEPSAANAEVGNDTPGAAA